jgi:hypothetical protein
MSVLTAEMGQWSLGFEVWRLDGARVWGTDLSSLRHQGTLQTPIVSKACRNLR